MKIKFLRKFKPAGDAPDIPTYKAGEVYDLAEDYAKKYVARGLAVEYVEPPPVEVIEFARGLAVEYVEPPPVEVIEEPVETKVEEPVAEVTYTAPRQQFRGNRRHSR